jgi:predicted  nucleic acid-binding Zn-ribbon protein
LIKRIAQALSSTAEKVRRETLEDAEGKYKCLKLDYDLLQKRIVKLIAEDHELQKQIDSLQKQIYELQGKLGGMEWQLDTQHDYIEECNIKQKRIDEIESDLDWYGTLIKRECIGTKDTPNLKVYIERLEKQIDELKKQLQAYEDQDKTPGQLGMECLRLEKKIDELKKENRIISEHNYELEKQVELLESTLKQKEKEIGKLREKLKSLDCEQPDGPFDGMCCRYHRDKTEKEVLTKQVEAGRELVEWVEGWFFRPLVNSELTAEDMLKKCHEAGLLTREAK